MPVSSPIQANVVRREKAIKYTVAASLGAKVFSVACTFAQVPIALRYLGAEAYGLWVTLVSVLLVLNFVDFGVGVGMQHAMARAFGSDDSVALRRSFWTGAAFLTGFALVAIALTVPIVWLFPWADILHVQDPWLRPHVGKALGITLLAFAVGLPFNAVSRLAAAVQRGWWHAFWIAVGSLLTLVAVAATAKLRWGFLPFLATAMFVPVVQGLGLFVHLCRQLGWPLRPAAVLPREQRVVMLQQSLFFALPQTGLALLQTLPPLAIATSCGAAAVTGFNLLMRLLGVLQQIQILYLTPLWPAYTEAHVRGERDWIWRSFGRSLAMTAALVVLSGLIAWKGDPLLHLWLRRAFDPVGRELKIATLAWCVVQLAAQPLVYFLVGLGRLRLLATCSVPGLAVTAVALFWPNADSAGDVLFAGATALTFVLLPGLVAAVLRVREPRPLRG